jgi:predicted nucleotidyltransferase
LKVLVEQFHPEQVILFGSYAYGTPDEHSDVDLLVVDDGHKSALKRRIQIRDAWWKMPRKECLLPFDLVVATPVDHRNRQQNSAGFYNTIVEKGLHLV